MKLRGEKGKAVEFVITDIYNLKSDEYAQLSREDAIQQIIDNDPHLGIKKKIALAFPLLLMLFPIAMILNSCILFFMKIIETMELYQEVFFDFAQYKTINLETEIAEPICKGDYAQSESDGLEENIEEMNTYLET